VGAVPEEPRHRRPKIVEAIATWHWFAREIGADLPRFYPGLSIKQWLTGAMDSAELLMLIDGLPDDSLFKTWSDRGGDWTDDQYIAARTANEVALSRADGGGYLPDLIYSPAQLQERADQEIRQAAVRRQGMNELTGKTRTRRKVQA
jgi:hypothetical protein